MLKLRSLRRVWIKDHIELFGMVNNPVRRTELRGEGELKTSQVKPEE
jgi:hypothetical protein